MKQDKPEEETLAKIKFVLLANNDAQAIRLLEQYGGYMQEQMYSQEEAKKFAFDFYYDMSRKMGVAENLISENATNVDVWFEKLKKG
jgi:hypothetical protein